MIKDLKFTVIDNKFPEVFAYVNQYDDKIIIISSSPFHNCQTYSISNFQEILRLENRLEVLQQINDVIEKNQLLIDINIDLIEELKEIFSEDDFIFITKYVNFTGSNMAMCLINVKNVLGGSPEDDDDDDDYDDDYDYDE